MPRSLPGLDAPHPPVPPTLAPPARQAGGRAGLGAVARTLNSDRVLPYLLVAPAVLLVFTLTIYPTVYVLATSFTDWSLMRAITKPVGFRNYVDLMGDYLAIRALVNTALFLV